MTTADLMQLRSMLQLSEAQVKAAQRIFDAHLLDDSTLRSRDAADLDRRARAFGTADARFEDPEVADSYRRLKRDRDALVDRLASLEASFFEELIPLLSESQLENLGRSRQARQRAFHRLVKRLYPGDDVDLGQFLASYLLEFPEVTPRDPAALDDLLREYEAAVTPLLVRLREESLGADTQAKLHQASVFAQARHLDRAARQALAPQFLNERRRILGPPVRTAKRIHDLTRSYAEALASQFTPGEHRRIMAAFDALTYPPLFPDPCDLMPLLDAAGDLVRNDPDRATDMQALAEAYWQTAASVNRELRDRYLQWEEELASTLRTQIDERAQYQEVMNQLLQSRLSNARVTFGFLKDALHQSELGQLSPESETIESLLARPAPVFRDRLH